MLITSLGQLARHPATTVSNCGFTECHTRSNAPKRERTHRREAASDARTYLGQAHGYKTEKKWAT